MSATARLHAILRDLRFREDEERRGLSSGPLSGTRVLEIAGEWFDLAGRYLADLGADVIRIVSQAPLPSAR
jgi:crotonobetainyl-CoA:carnitine CoA-transferase CaiB-like acyl-CoA transferase